MVDSDSMSNNSTFSIVHYNDGTIEIIADYIHEKSPSGKLVIINQNVLDYMKDNKTSVAYVESGIKHLQIYATPRLDIQNGNRIEFGEDDFVNNYNEA